jgi:hypothetical protein
MSNYGRDVKYQSGPDSPAPLIPANTFAGMSGLEASIC